MNGQKVMGGERHEWAESEGRVEKGMNLWKVNLYMCSGEWE